MIVIPLSFYKLNGKKLQRQYRDYLSEFKQWKQKKIAFIPESFENGDTRKQLLIQYN
ncbi:hypothetical protein QVZ41_05625 [Wenyingzhuangia sp. chi5]|uniref:Acyltransferase n=1 Tax=Wenyingzhuangia gilva TaxID=3057677 RepID=A0ABT8VQT0_9FLAO|nr:hypothetical protein [Wenyingzhuangia sp. chi5]MDO3694324.1 hypothetical protein [Wenyingzhuangia sp. chi5]